MKAISLVVVVFVSAAPPTSAPDKKAFASETDVSLPGLVDVATQLPVEVQLKYATADNFMGRDVYGGLKRCFLVPEAAQMLARAHALLQERAPGLTFVMYDCARPRRVQLIMWDVVKGTPKQGYVADPTRPPGSIHNTGCAVDMSLWNRETNAAVDMGTPYDFFGKKAEPRAEIELWKNGTLSNEQLANRLLLREIMLRAGFRILPHEWWHFDCTDGRTARQRFSVIE